MFGTPANSSGRSGSDPRRASRGGLFGTAGSGSGSSSRAADMDVFAVHRQVESEIDRIDATSFFSNRTSGSEPMPVYGMDAFLAAAAADDERLRGGTKPISRAADPASSRSSTSSAASQWDLHVDRRTTAPASSIATRAPTPRAPPTAAPPSVSRTHSAPDVMPTAAPPSRHVLLQTPMNGTVARPADTIMRPAPPATTRAGSASSLARSAIATPAPMAARTAARVPADFPTPSHTTCDDMVTEDFYGPAPPSSRSPRPAADPREEAENMVPRSRDGAAGRMRPPVLASTPAPASRSRSHVAMSSRDEEARRIAAATLPAGAVLDESVVIKGIRYWPTEELGHGGTSVVYRALSSKTREWCAVKKVKLDPSDPVTSATYLEEAQLLERLNNEKCDAVIKLIGYEVSSCKRYLYLVLELGDTDMAKVLKLASVKPLNLALVRYYWRMMIECVHSVHQHRVVHADLKPANFLLVKNQLKLIDFGIAKPMAPDTTKVFHDSQVGTLNYMAPEAVLGLDSDDMAQKRMRLNRGTDVWSLGVILYQMLYGRTPFAHLTADQRMKRIPDPKFAITFPRLRRGATPASAFLPMTSGPSLASLSPAELEPIGLAVQAVQVCLQRDAGKRRSLAELLVHPFVAPERYMAGAAGDTFDDQFTG
ncbi:hypothetical protein GGF31_008463 [Allomyces arbusculus]|nr:hypothetical protein GGF31_008463 [Allomyces arbusculus]